MVLVKVDFFEWKCKVNYISINPNCTNWVSIYFFIVTYFTFLLACALPISV